MTLIVSAFALCHKKNVSTLSCNNFGVHESTLIITEKVSNQKMLYFPPHLSSASALPGETQKHNNPISLNAVLLHCQTSAIHWFNFFSLLVTYADAAL